MADLGDGDLSLQRHSTRDWPEDEDYEAPGSPHLDFEYASLDDAAAQGIRSPTKSWHRKRDHEQEDDQDIGNAMITPSIDEIEQPQYLVGHGSPVAGDTVRSPGPVSRPTAVGPGSADVPHVAVKVKQVNEDTAVKEGEEEGGSKLDVSPPEPISSPLSRIKSPRSAVDHHGEVQNMPGELSGVSHQQLTQQPDEEAEESDDGDVWQDMPVYAAYDIYDDDGKLIAREHEEEAPPGYRTVETSGGAKGYTKVMVDEDAKSATSMDDNTAYLFDKRNKDAEDDDDLEARDPLAQMNETKSMLTDNQRIAYVGVVRLAIAEMAKEMQKLERTRGAKKALDFAQESMLLWSQKVMVRLYAHMELDSAEQIMIEQLADHGLQPSDLTPTLMQNARVKNPMVEPNTSGEAEQSPVEGINSPAESSRKGSKVSQRNASVSEDALPAYEEHDLSDMPEVRTPSQLPTTEKLDIDLRWTILCDLFLLLISDSVYDARSRTLLEQVGAFMEVPWLDICRFEKRVAEALEMQDIELKEDLAELEHMASRKKKIKRKKLMMMGLATVGGGLVIGLSAGLLAPVIGAGLVAGLGTIGVSGGGTFLAGAGGAALIGTTGALSGGTIGGRAAARRMGSVRTFEYRPLFNNRRVNLVITLAGWMTGKVDDVRLPYSTIDPVMGDVVSVLWEPEMLRSMGDTINILATEALTQGLQQILGSTILISLMAALQLPVVLTKLAYLIDNPWSVSMTRADMAGLIMADSLIDRNLGARPITLVGFSLGSRVIFSCLRELARKGAVGLVQNVYMFGSPVVISKDDWIKARSVVSGRFVNGYATNDWILGYLFRATAGGIMRVAGLVKVDIPGIENLDVTQFVPGHMAYRKAMPRCLREAGWAIESDEFTEIEDPDPENHQNRQRELINEIEEARKELQKKPEKKRWFWKGKAQRAKKQEWETYEEKPAEDGAGAAASGEGVDPEHPAGDVMFDVEAIRREAIELAAQGIENKEPARPPQPAIRSGSIFSLRSASASQTSLQTPSSPSKKTWPDLRGTKSYETMQQAPPPAEPSTQQSTSTSSVDPHASNNHDHLDPYHYEDEAEISMSFEPSSPIRSATMPLPSARTEQLARQLSSNWSQADLGTRPAQSRHVDDEPVGQRHDVDSGYQQGRGDGDMGSVAMHNVWEDEEDEFGHEREVSMTFE